MKELKKKLESRASPSVISIGSSSSDKDNKPAQNQHEVYIDVLIYVIY